MNKTTTHVGGAGSRVVLQGTVTHVRVFPTEWGFTTVVRFENAEGVLASWRWTGRHDDEVHFGQAVTVRATIRDYHDVDGDVRVRLMRGELIEDALQLV